MFVRRRRTSKSPDSRSEVASYIIRQRCLVALLVPAATCFLIWPLLGLLEPMKFETPYNTSTTATVEKNVAFSLNERSASTYCRITSCTGVDCTGSSNAGAVASEFLETIFKAKCNTTQTVKLSFTNCMFPENVLRKNWLLTNLSIEELQLNGCTLREIEDEAFDRPIFGATRSLSLVKNNLAALRKASFQHLTHLSSLFIRDNIIKQADWNLLESVAGTLESLELSGAIDDPLVLRNITGAGTLGKLIALYLQRNLIQKITDESFVGVPKVEVLHLSGSGIKTLSQGSLQPMSSSIKILMMTGNEITSLPKGLIDRIICRPLIIALENNPWNCDCGLQWMQDMIKDASIITNVPICLSPSENAGKSFAIAEFCRSNSTATSTTTLSTEESTPKTSTDQTASETPTEAEKVTVNCSLTDSIFAHASQRKLLSTDLLILSRLHGFFVESVTDKSIMLKLPSLDQQLTLLWFESGDAERSVSCAKHVSHIYQVENIDPQTTYTICLLNDNEGTASPLDCLAATTLPTYMSRTWLTNRHKTGVIVVLTVTAVLVFALGILVAYLSIRKHPSLLRGSKRVMLVKKNIVDAIVLPKGVNVEEHRSRSSSLKNSKSEDEYLTPLPSPPVPPPRVARISRVSLQSDWNSYVSEVEPSESQLASWTMGRIYSEVYTPPLPPHPPNEIPSLSLTVEDREEDSGYETAMVELR